MKVHFIWRNFFLRRRICAQPSRSNFIFNFYLKNSCQRTTQKRTGPRTPFANLGRTVTLKDYNENSK